MKKKADIYIRSRVHTWTTKLDDEQLKDWAKIFKLKLDKNRIIARGSVSHYVNPTPRFCASAGMSEVIVLPENKKKPFSKNKKRKKK